MCDRMILLSSGRCLWLTDGCCCVLNSIIESREAVIAELIKLEFEVIPSAANFIFTRHLQHEAADIAAGLREKNIIIRHFKQTRIEQYLRITIGTTEENNCLLAA